MDKIELNLAHCHKFVSEQDYDSFQPSLTSARDEVLNKSGQGHDFLGWVDLPASTEKEIINDIINVAEKIRLQSTHIVVIGIGGSYLGARAIIEALSPYFKSKTEDKPEIIYAGHQLSEEYHTQLLRYLDTVDYSVIVISKSGTTTEPAIAFRLIRQHLEKKYGHVGASNRITAITDKEKGALKTLATQKGYSCFTIPNDVGGRYSVLTPVGLLPIATAGFDINALIAGAQDMRNIHIDNVTIDTNPIMKYAATRQILSNKGFIIEILNHYEPSLSYVVEWWKQLFGESEGKEGKGIFPAGAGFTTDLHSLGQYIQEGPRHLFSTILDVKNPSGNTQVSHDADNLDGLNYLTGKSMNEINAKAMQGTIMAHYEGSVPNIIVSIPFINAYYLGQLICFFEMACAISGYMMQVNPFDQPGVESYKKNMFHLLKKPGY